MNNKLLHAYSLKVLRILSELGDMKCSEPRPFLIVPVVFALLILLAPLFGPDHAFAIPTHLDISKIQGGCSECHMGHGKSGTPMLKSKKGGFCFICHSKTGSGDAIKGRPAVDIHSEILKPSRHPVTETARYHIKNEILPETSSSTPRHVSCYDCHNVHQAEKGNKLKGVRGYSGRGGKVRKIKDREAYTLCYKCHSDSMNLPFNASNISLDFDPANSSFHPVESIGKRGNMPSLKNDLTSSSMISCVDCHGNDDEFGPKGPHGSRYSPLLRYNYNRTEGPESVTAYDICYNCHERSSILKLQVSQTAYSLWKGSLQRLS
jgi:predicted CXXCH cytochrome family protein